jgi:[DsrC]-trisulfide reductase subunit J
MRDRVLIAGGLAVFLILFTYPLWHAAAMGTQAKQPQLQLPTQAKECVAPIPYMRAAHMRLLIDWRENVVRRNIREIHAANGKTYDASLTRTCLGQCHTDRAEFCDRCHNYSGVSALYCWDCHNKPQLVAARRTP